MSVSFLAAARGRAALSVAAKVTDRAASDVLNEHVACVVCIVQYPRAHFSSKQWNSRTRTRGIQCRSCSSRAHRDLDALSEARSASATNRLASGVQIRKNNHGYCNYVDRLFASECFPTLVQLRLFPSAKDCSESMGALQAAGTFGGAAAGEPSVRTKEEATGERLSQAAEADMRGAAAGSNSIRGSGRLRCLGHQRRRIQLDLCQVHPLLPQIPVVLLGVLPLPHQILKSSTF